MVFFKTWDDAEANFTDFLLISCFTSNFLSISVLFKEHIKQCQLRVFFSPPVGISIGKCSAEYRLGF